MPIFWPFLCRRQQTSLSTRIQDEHSSLITVSFEGNGANRFSSSLSEPGKRFITAPLPEACDDVCQFVSVASFSVIREDNNLLRFQGLGFTYNTCDDVCQFVGVSVSLSSPKLATLSHNKLPFVWLFNTLRRERERRLLPRAEDN